MSDLAELFDAMEARGLQPPRHLEPGKRVRFPDGGKIGDKAGWCLLFHDMQGAVFGSWRGGWTESWQAKRGAPMSEAERAAFRAMVAKARQDAEGERQAEYAAAAERAQKAWETAAPAPADHPYLVAKKIDPDGLRVASDGRLMAPVHGPDGALQTLQYIGPDGGKMFLSGGKMAGGRFAIQTREDGPLVLVEGIATGKSIASAMPDASVAACFSATNLAAVAKDLRAKHPARNIVIAGDDDTRTAGNPGRTKAELAAQEIGAQAVFPDGCCDWNDYQRAHGIEATGAALQAAISPPKKIFTRIGEILANPQPIDWLIKHYIPRKAVIVLLGQPGRGKTYLALDWACHIATGREWAGNKVKGALPVCYVAGEGRDAIQRRLAAWHTLHGGLQDAPLSVSETAIRLNDLAAFKMMDAEIMAMAHPPALLVVDTVARCLDGDENGPEAMGGFVRAMDQIKDKHGCAVVALHHPSKANPRDPRGHSSLLGAIDATFLLEGRDGGTIVLLNSKQRGGRPSKPVAFEFKSVELPRGYRDPDEPLIPVWESVLEQQEMPIDEANDPERGLKDKQRLALSVLRQLIAEAQRNLMQIGRDPTTAKIESKDWRDAAKKEGIEPRHYSRIAKSLIERGLVVVDGAFVALKEESPNHQTGPNDVNGPAQISPNTPHTLKGVGVWCMGFGVNDEVRKEEGENSFLATEEIIEEVEI
ncbi:AAA family ATPase [Acidithiobacillus sp. CV18-2]|nr:AAA family ATPase [Acidithiobacillus sp. CV18-3]MBU2757352.1 AAA family ATPase [Acidithiobacillus sp. BN09-2]MBU2776069.1 AAA family ATPase [Acidithiobacillus sp. CV18-2]MBU2800254.1 AAA family ATPase [Acidithiobacillus sp. VAN18-4]